MEEEFRTKIYTYSGRVKKLYRECVNAIEYITLDYEDEDTCKFIPQGDIYNVVVIVSKEKECTKYVGYGIGEIRSGERTFWISSVYFEKQEVALIIIEEIEKYFNNSGVLPQRQNYYYYSNSSNFPYNMERLSYHKILLDRQKEKTLLDKQEETVYAKPLDGKLDGEIRIFDTIPDSSKIDWLLRSNINFLDELDKDEFLKCIEAMDCPHVHTIALILDQMCGEESIYEKIYCIFSMKYHGLNRLYTMEEIVYHNYIIECFYLRRNNIVDMYDLNDNSKYYTRMAKSISVIHYSKKKMKEICRNLLEYNDKLGINKYSRAVIIHQMFRILGKNISFVQSNEKFIISLTKKIKEFRTRYCNPSNNSQEDLLISDMIVDIQWLAMLDLKN